jgi:ABC-type polysaccharide/polyol phosphate export permease
MYRDISYLVGIFMQILFYATPIIYPITLVPDDLRGVPARWLIENLNPVTAFVSAARESLYLLEAPRLSQWLVMTAWATGALVLGWWAFGRKAAALIEEL